MAILREIDSLASVLRLEGNLRHTVVQGLDLSHLDWATIDCDQATFLGCTFPESLSVCDLFNKGATVFPSFPNLPYNPYRSELYYRAELMLGWTPTGGVSADESIYNHFQAAGRDNPPVLESLSQRLHDHAVDDALRDLLEGRTDSSGKKKVVGIMGGHGTLRTDPYFKKVAYFAREMTQAGYFIATGGGPGIMEAGNLGAYLSQTSVEEFEEALIILARAPHYTDPQYVHCSQEVLDLNPQGEASLAVPTWFYGHEPTNMFSTRIAKYFSNSIREDGLLAIATHGVLFAPGSAGTTQEVFMDGTQNHYATYDFISPMVFLGEQRYGDETLIYECIQKQASGKAYADFLFLTDEPSEAVKFIQSHPPTIPQEA